MPNRLSHQDRTVLKHALADSAPFATERSRRALIYGAVRGYPLSGEIDNVLRTINWEGSEDLVAGDVVNRLEGHEPSPGIPALALIAQAIEPMSGTAHREKLADLRRRLQWGAPDPAPAGDWRDPRSPAEVTLERIIGENTLRPIHYLRRAVAAADAVVRVDVDGAPQGTGFLVAQDLMVTNHHVIANDTQARAAQAGFFEEALDHVGQGAFRRKAVWVRTAGVSPLLHTNPALDITLVRLQGSPQLQRYLPLKPKVLKQDDRVAIIQHPGGYPKQISLQNNLVAHADTRIVQYYTSTKAGSSGSPVFDDEFAVVAIHHGWVHNPAWDGGGKARTGGKDVEDLQYRNQGTSVIALIEDLRNQAPHLLAGLTILPEQG